MNKTILYAFFGLFNTILQNIVLFNQDIEIETETKNVYIIENNNNIQYFRYYILMFNKKFLDIFIHYIKVL